MTSLNDVITAMAALVTKVSTLHDDNTALSAELPNGLKTTDAMSLAIPAVITYNGSWPARSTATSQATRRVIWIGNPGGSPPVGMLTNDIWTQGT